MSQEVLWQGSVAIRRGIFATPSYAILSKEGIIIKKNKKDDAKVEREISASSIKSVTTGKGDLMEYMITGYQGFKVIYEGKEKEEKLQFWPNTFGAYPNTKEIQPFGEALAKITGADVEVLTANAKNSANDTFATSIMFIVSIFLCGALPALIVAAAFFASLKIWKNEEMNPTLRKVLAIALTGAGFAVALIINIAVAVMLEK